MSVSSRPIRVWETELRSCVNVDVAVLGSPSLIIVRMVSVDVKQHCNSGWKAKLRSCVKVDVAVLGALPVPNVHRNHKAKQGEGGTEVCVWGGG